MYSKNLWVLAVLLMCLLSVLSNAQTTYSIDVTQKTHKISPYIYGVSYRPYPQATAKLFGGDRMTTFNWENNASTGEYSGYNNDAWLPFIIGVQPSDWLSPGASYSKFYDDSEAAGQMPLLVLPMAGKVARDTMCKYFQPSQNECFNTVTYANDGLSVFPPDTTDTVVYVDHSIKYIADSLAPSNMDFGFCLDNEPNYWFGTHPYEGYTASDTTNLLRYDTLLAKSQRLAASIRANAPDALIFGPSVAGMEGLLFLHDAPDYFTYNQYSFIEYYIKMMTEGSADFLDVVDVHWYPLRWLYDSIITIPEDQLQFTRSFWDSTYQYNDFSLNNDNHQELIPSLKKIINKYDPNLKLSISEYAFGAEEDITGALMLADALGIFGREEVYYASLWPTKKKSGDTFGDSLSSYFKSAMDMYLNYDGAGGAFADNSIYVENTDNKASVYASISDEGDTLHIIAINKSKRSKPIAVSNIPSDRKVAIYYLDGTSSTIQQGGEILIDSDSLDYTLPPYSITHFVITDSIGNGTKELAVSPITIYPNPSSGWFKLINNTVMKIDIVELYDINGCLRKVFDAGSTTYDISDLASAWYAVKVIQGDHHSYKSIYLSQP